MKVLEQARRDGLEVPVIPMALTNLWGSYFSRIERVGGRPTAMVRPLRRGLFNRVELRVGTPLQAEAVNLQDLQNRVFVLATDQVTTSKSIRELKEGAQP